jgi:hypothetical protein
MLLSYLFIAFLLAHGLIHFLGFAKAFFPDSIPSFKTPVSKSAGALWLVSGLSFLAVAGLWATGKNWIPWACFSLGFSQLLIFFFWKDAKAGTVANALIGLAVFLSLGKVRFEERFLADVNTGISQESPLPAKLLSEADLKPLPFPVQKYLRYVGVVGKPIPKQFRAVFLGQMREKGKDWFPFRSVQHNFWETPTRLFFMKAKMFGLTIPGYHAYKNGRATMEIKPFGMIPVVDLRNNELNKAETVTFFNDVCVLAPAWLADPRIGWDSIDSLTAKAWFSVGIHRISAVLHFNARGELVDFVSDDRYAVSEMKKYRFSTPLSDYKDFNGFRIASKGDAVWHHADGLFVYGKFDLQSLEYR